MTTTDRAILSLSREAAEAGDLDQVVLCDLALGGPEALAGAEPGTAAAELLARGMTQDEARAECERVIEAARASAEPELVAGENFHGWYVNDGAGGRWWPSPAATALIEAASDPEAEVLRLCRETPHLGTWHS